MSLVALLNAHPPAPLDVTVRVREFGLVLPIQIARDGSNLHTDLSVPECFECPNGLYILNSAVVYDNGHYLTVVRQPSRNWVLLDDTRVLSITKETAFSHIARSSMFFYSRAWPKPDVGVAVNVEYPFRSLSKESARQLAGCWYLY